MERDEGARREPSPAELCALIDARLDGALSPARAAHSRRTAELAGEICARAGLDPWRGRAAGLAHDLCKDMTRDEQRALAALYPEAVAVSSLMADKVLHGPAAAALLVRDYGTSDPGILEAVAFHTIGRVGMGTLAAAVYCADKLEPGRAGVDAAFREACVALPPPRMLVEVVRRGIGWLESRGKAVAPETLVLYNSLADGALAE
jgi:predicted HD superfamily hydrolase involved in NAD metabolism